VTALGPVQVLLAAGFLLLAVTAAVLIVRGWGSARSFTTLAGQVLIVTAGVALWPALVLAELGHFSLLNLDLVLVIVCAGIALGLSRRRRPLQAWPRPGFSWQDGALIVVLVIAGALFARPGELIVGGEDPGVYMNTGIHIARAGGIEIKDDVLAAVPAELSRDRLYAPAAWYLRYVDGSIFPGFYVLDAAEGRMVPQFFHLFPTAIAILYEMGGLPLALYTTPLFALASLFMLYLLGRELAGKTVGVLAAGLLGLNISQIWFARVSFSDVVLQFWLLGGLWTLSTLIGREERGAQGLGLTALISGSCFGMAHLTKLDSYVVPVIVVGYAGIAWLLGRFRRPQVLLVGAYFLLAVHAAAHAVVFSAYYVYVMFSQFTGLLQLAAIGVIAGIAALVVISRYRARLVGFITGSTRYQTPARMFFVVVIVLGSLYLYFVRPLLADLGEMAEAQIAERGQVIKALSTYSIEPEQYKHLGEPTRTFVEEGIVRMGWYLTPLGVWLGIAGLTIWTLSKPGPKVLPFLGATLVYSGIVFYKGAIRSDFFWAFKRYVPLVIPAFMLLIAYVVWQLGRVQSRLAFGILPPVLVAVLATSYIAEDLNVVGDVEYRGAIDQITDLNEVFPPNALILFESSASASGVGTPLRFVFGRTVYPVTVEQINSAPMQKIIENWLDQDLPVYWITPTGTTIDTYGSLRKVAERRISWSNRAISWEELPKTLMRFSARLRIFQIEGAEFAAPSQMVDANLGNEIVLLGYDLDDSSVAAGETLVLDLYWYATHQLEKDYTVFVHILEDNAIMRGQWDGQPMDGARPTSSWKAGEIIDDRLEVPIFAETPPGSYTLSVGLYEWPSITRLPLLEEGQPVDDRVILTEIEVRGAR
jgi:4-amino-4-deoxy-L-arabinose transferase-like glycosyltransferase